MDDKTKNAHSLLNLNLHNFGNFSSDYGIPEVFPCEDVPTDLIAWGVGDKPTKGFAHFFLDDYRIERLWSNPRRYLPSLSKYDGVLAPDFSVFTDFPVACQIWNVYRSRWLARFWHLNGIRVIPTISWSDERSYRFCFDGIQEGSTVSVSTVGVRKKRGYFDAFLRGYNEMMLRIKPRLVVCYGSSEGLSGNVVDFSPRYNNIKNCKEN